MASTTGFIDYPEPIEGPDDAYKPKEENNPVLRGVPLVLFSRLSVNKQTRYDPQM